MKPVPVWEERSVVEEIGNNLTYDMKKFVIQTIQKAVAEEIAELQKICFGYAEKQLLESAEGNDLDFLSAYYDIYRQQNENDNELKQRVLVNFKRQSISVSRGDIEDLLEQILGDDSFTIINRTGSNIWLMTPIACYTSKDYSTIADMFPLNHNLKVSNYERAYLGRGDNPNAKPFSSFFVEGDEVTGGSFTAFVYDRERSLYGN